MMKTSKVSVLSAAILLVATGIGFGIAQAGGTHSDRPVLSFEDQEALDSGGFQCSYQESRPVLSFEGQEAIETAGLPASEGEDRPVLSFEDQEATQVAMLEQAAERCARR